MINQITIRVCQDCIELKGQECHEPECVFCFRGMEEVRVLLDKVLICPIVDGERLILWGATIPTATSHLELECAMCGQDNSFIINSNDPSTGFCMAEKTFWTIRSSQRDGLEHTTDPK